MQGERGRIIRAETDSPGKTGSSPRQSGQGPSDETGSTRRFSVACYYHPGVAAVTQCVICEKPLCKACRVFAEQRNYCKVDAETLLVREERVQSMRRRGYAITLASALTVLEGIAGSVVGFLLLILGLMSPSQFNSDIFSTTVQPFLQYFGAVLTFSSEQSIFLGFGLVVLGTVEIVAGYYLWRRSRLAAVTSIAISVIGLGLIGSFGVILALAGAFTFIHIGSVIVKIGAVGYGWPHLKRGYVAPRPQTRRVSSRPQGMRGSP